jgi:hypothetical protein
MFATARRDEKSRQRYVTAAEILAGLAPVPLTPGLQEDIWRRVSETLGFGGANGGARVKAHETTARPRRTARSLSALKTVAALVAAKLLGLLKLPGLAKLPLPLIATVGIVAAGGLTAGLVVALTSAAAPAHDPKYVWSPSHDAGVPSSDRTVTMSWSRQPEAIAYSVLWSHQPKQEPDKVRDLPGSALGTTSPTLTPGRWYFHLRTESRRHSWTDTVHRGPYVIVAESSAGAGAQPAPPPPASYRRT